MRILLSVFASLALSVGAAAGHAADLTEIYSQALDNDPQLKQATAIYGAAQEQAAQARANFLPQLSAGANATRAEFAEGELTEVGYTVSLNQSLYDESNFVLRRRARSAIEQAEAEFQSSQQELVLRVADAYFAVLAAQDALDFSRAEKEAFARQLEQTRQRFEVGLVAITDVNESQATYDLTVAQEIEAENTLDTARETLRTLTGQYYGELETLAEDMPLPEPTPTDINAWTEAALNQNLSIIAAQQGVIQAHENINLARAARYPTLGAFVSYEQANTTTSGRVSSSAGLDGTQTTIGLQLNWNLYAGGSINSNIRQARQNEQANMYGLEALKRDTQLQVRSAYLNVVAGISRVKALNQAVVSSQSALQATEAGYEVGTRTTVDVLDARRAVFAAKRDYAQSRYNYLINTLRLKQAASMLTVNDLNLVNAWLR